MQARYSNTILWRGDRCMVQIDRGIYGLPQAGKLAQEQLVKHLATHRYVPAAATECLFHHVERNVFTLIVDDFLVKYTIKEDADYFC